MKINLFEHKFAQVKLEVRALSSFDNSNWNQIVEGSDVKILCRVDANPTDIDYRWYLNDEPLFPKVLTELVIHNISRQRHESIVKCEAYNSIGKSEDSETLEVMCKYHGSLLN